MDDGWLEWITGLVSFFIAATVAVLLLGGRLLDGYLGAVVGIPGAALGAFPINRLSGAMPRLALRRAFFSSSPGGLLAAIVTSLGGLTLGAFAVAFGVSAAGGALSRLLVLLLVPRARREA